MPLKTATKIGCSFFDQHDMQLLNDYKVSFFRFATTIFNHKWSSPTPWNFIAWPFTCHIGCIKQSLKETRY